MASASCWAGKSASPLTGTPPSRGSSSLASPLKKPCVAKSSLMIGAIAQARPGKEDIVLNDKELDDAKWFSIEDVRTALKVGTGGLGEGPPEGYKEGDLRLPPVQAIANRLLSAVAEGFLAAVPKI